MTKQRYLTFGVAASIAGFAALALGLCAPAGARQVTCGETGWSATAQGSPAVLAGSGSGYYAWHDRAGWHLRLRASSSAQLTGSVAAGARLRVVRASAPVRTGLKATSQGFSFRLSGTGKTETVDFTAGCASRLSFELGPRPTSTGKSSGPSVGAPSGPSVGAPSATTSPSTPPLPVYLGARGRAPGPFFVLARPANTGVVGEILIGPTCPVENPDNPCPPRKAASAAVSIQQVSRTKGGGPVGPVMQITSDAQGKFASDLEPGRYLVTVVGTGPPIGQPKPSVVEVESGVVTHVVLLVDSGIR